MDASNELVDAVCAAGLLDEKDVLGATALTGGVSSDIWKLDTVRGPVCVKRALARLKVAADWRAPVERNRYEYEWFLVARDVAPDCVPRLLGRDAKAGLFIMEYLDPARYPVWKERLRRADADPRFAARVGATLASIHAATARDPAMAVRFSTDDIFGTIRLEPYLLATAEKHPDRSGRLRELAATTAATRLCLVHGDVSPKNILAGPRGPVFLDAECAWYGDPAFDLAFCLNHLLLKCLLAPAAREDFLACHRALAEAYLALVDWEAPRELERRAAELLPGLMLARVDGKSPVEYLTREDQKDAVRRCARALLAAPATTLQEVRESWRQS